MTLQEAYAIARELANQYQVWYEVHTNGTDYIVLPQGDVEPGYTHDMSFSPVVKVPNGNIT